MKIFRIQTFNNYFAYLERRNSIWPSKYQILGKWEANVGSYTRNFKWLIIWTILFTGLILWNSITNNEISYIQYILYVMIAYQISQKISQTYIYLYIFIYSENCGDDWRKEAIQVLSKCWTNVEFISIANHIIAFLIESGKLQFGDHIFGQLISNLCYQIGGKLKIYRCSQL